MTPWRRTLRPALALAALALALAGASTSSAKEPLFRLVDPRGDDHGDGSLSYPATLREDYARGDLDLVAFEAEAVSGGTELTFTFARPVRKPPRRPVDEGGTQLDTVARLGFYTFNVDVYVDTDRQPGSGRVTTLPGRVAEVDPTSGWEKVVCLTPRPEVARIQLRRILSWAARQELKKERGRLEDGEIARVNDQVSLDIARDYLFPSRVRVSGSKVRCVVPSTFFGGIAKPTWSYVVAVTAATVQAEVEAAAMDDDSWLQTSRGGRLMNRPVVAGGAVEALGTSKNDAELMPAIVDLIVPPGTSQEKVLDDWDLLAERRVRLPGVVPADLAAAR